MAATLAAIIVLVLGGWLWWSRHQASSASAGYRTAAVDRGDIRVAISATGTLGAISTVDVGSQISGQVTEVLADFNDHVRKGDVLARIDPSTYQAQIAQGAAAVASARANLGSAQATLRNADADFSRKSRLAQQQLVARSDADLARAARDQASAQVRAAQAQIIQQQASTQTARLNLQRAVIRSPVDGVVLTRTIEPGQTVAASLQAPVLFQIAEDLSKMEIVLAIDEADIGQVKPGQAVAFSVDAFPDKQYRGSVQQVRLSATNTSNVISYPVVVAVDNSDRTLLPGMTANAEIEVSRRADVLRVPNSALRYKPDEEAASPTATTASARGPDPTSELPAIAQRLQLNASQRAVFDTAIAAMQARAAQRRSASAAASSTSGSSLFGGRTGQPQRNGGANTANQGAMRQRMLERMNQQFAGFRATLGTQQQQQWDRDVAALAGARRAPLYLLADGKPKQVMVRIGSSDGTNTEVAGDIHAGDKVIVGSERATTAP
ncbi:efflux RND transporter periplasmic adaptor subunit [Cognatiluteimonas profundi]|uniref:efflux RND transporter periplasmic adaptor subunit n=1 Tax=Cognatiluteimonas profundi TaxID=2594501 RepID=UPI001E315B15|nr:efflux RND transporter periplasmic adaptor subunit [Lysobacter profundi]